MVRAITSNMAKPMRLPFHTYDVFTDQRFGGNPLAIVRDADGLDGAQMQTVAREFNLSETVFVLKPNNPAHTARVRIFTPGGELPFAGHPTVGTAALLAALRTPNSAGADDSIIVMEQPIGIVRVGVRLKSDGTAFAEFDAPKLPKRLSDPASTDRLAAALGVLPAEIGFENHKPTLFSAGNDFLFVPIGSLEAMARAEVMSQHWADAMPRVEPVGVCVYCRQTVHVDAAFHLRVFAPHHGVPEDPATGSAAVGFAGVVREFDDLRDGHHRKKLEQGIEMGRPSVISLSLEVAGGVLNTVRIGGNAVHVSEGVLTI